MLSAENRGRTKNRGPLITIAVFVAIVLVFLLVLHSVSDKTEQQQATFLEETVHRAVITCFAIEGRYPPSLDYLADNYGIRAVLDNDKFIISYNAFASNIYPDIAVLRVGME